ncbi:hypothetical protein M0R45_027881 [Rubus argutus]|uniref:RRM domain-containing protein n=1 Tax=Rubus argutus TaxID=59490 RepID=A0AAW1W468_RUBAR
MSFAKIYSQLGVIKEDGFWMPLEPETQKTMGYCFIEFNTPQEAELAREKTHGYKLDRSHIFAVSINPYTPGENLQHWLTDPELVYKRQFWTESFVQWSPLGTYLATVHRQGAAVWGGATDFKRLCVMLIHRLD